jgi:hypothetical protein
LAKTHTKKSQTLHSQLDIEDLRYLSCSVPLERSEFRAFTCLLVTKKSKEKEGKKGKKGIPFLRAK